MLFYSISFLKCLCYSIGHDIQAKTAENLYSGKNKVAHLTFRYDQTDELLGKSQIMFKIDLL